MHRAGNSYNIERDVKPPPVEVMRQVQVRTGQAYVEGQVLLEAGCLKLRLSRNEAIGNVAYDMMTERKLPSKPQIRGFFSSDFRPDSVVIVRPSQLGPKSTYIIKKPGK